MELVEFKDLLCVAITGSLRDFLAAHSEETPYALALMLGQHKDYIGLAIATEQALQRRAEHYFEIGYRYDELQELDEHHLKMLKVSLRWNHPDEGWYYEELAPRYEVLERLSELQMGDAFGRCYDGLEKFCTQTLKKIQRHAGWRSLNDQCSVIVGVYLEDSPQDFLRTATRCNPWRKTTMLWQEFWAAEQADKLVQKR